MPTPFPTPVRPRFTVQRGDIVVEAKLNGRVSPLPLYIVYFEISGQVREVYANVNDVVAEGQLLGELDTAQELRASANETQRIIRRAQIDLEIEKLTLEQMQEQGCSGTEIEIQKLKVELAHMDFDELMESMGIDPNAVVTDELDTQVAQARAFSPADGTIISAVAVGRKVGPTIPAFVLGDPETIAYTVRVFSILLDQKADQTKLVQNDLNTIVDSWSSADLNIRTEQQRPERQSSFGLLSVGFVSLALLTVLGFLLYALFSFRRRFIEMSMLRAIGLSVKQMTSLLADVLFGDSPFMGKSAYSWPRSNEQLPININNSKDKTGCDAPLFPFGYGLVFGESMPEMLECE